MHSTNANYHIKRIFIFHKCIFYVVKRMNLLDNFVSLNQLSVFEPRTIDSKTIDN